MSKEGFRYVGADLPFAMEMMKPCMDKATQEVEELMECRGRIKYDVVDANGRCSA